MTPDEPFGAWLRRQRKARDLTQAALAELVGCSASVITKLERDDRRPSRELAERLAQMLGVPAAERAGVVQRARVELPAATQTPAPAPTAPRSALPAARSSFIGREQERAALLALLAQPEVRLVTLTGPGGVGKTRLVLEVARALPELFSDGLWFVALAPLAEPSQVPAAIARALGLSEDGEQELSLRIQGYLARRAGCLILDNAEHLLPSAPMLAQLLQHAPRLTLLVTSRARLNLSGEHCFAVPPLACPPRSGAEPYEHLLRSDAIQLFAARAAAVDRGFRLTQQTIGAVHAICARLDGLALALELAAAQLRYYGLEGLLAQLEQPLALLTNGPRDVDPRHQTLLDTIAWSYERIPPEAQALFRRLSVLVDGWTIPAMEAICGVGAPPGSCRATLYLLLDHQLVYRLGEGEEPRFGMLETIRAYALEQLRQSGEEELIRARHLDFFVADVAPGERLLFGAQLPRWRERLEAAYPNIRAALAWSLAGGNALGGLRLAASLWSFWGLRESNGEGQTWLEATLGAAGDQRAAFPDLYANAMHALGRTLIGQSRYVESGPTLEQALALARQSGDRWRTACILNDLGYIWCRIGAYPEAERCYAESLALHRELGTQDDIGSVLMNRGTLAYRMADFDAATRYYQQALTIFRATDNPGGLAMTLNNLGAVSVERQDWQAAERYLLECLPIRKLIGVRAGTMITTTNLADVAVLRGDLAQARVWLAEALALYQTIEEVDRLIGILVSAIKVLLAEETLAPAVLLWGALQQVLRRHGIVPDPRTQAWHASIPELSPARLSPDEFHDAQLRGAAMGDAELLAALKAVLSPPANVVP